ncbi:MAG: NADH-ubiquinone oxidoreductase chain 4L [Candidatus Parvarchaeum acidophilus ARMAN-5]|jgi:NADH-quinone oxidoreductase subunit K|uniref:NADH-ubiquinone oxidoreductase chain 4L n=1 Tax=Candidatus Parvarchaeum acidophilus ARMAN-5 TaxID=662762 RepID=D6GWC2_PARA5|nr:MAG: NADH-ubiquinone oxidoreductase chain 4L [Candidatus Parvarchaeum acidophilus ARMAN-5]
MIPESYFLLLTTILFAIGLYGIISRREGISIIISSEIIVNAALINFISAANFYSNLNGVSYALITLIMVVFETVVFIALMVVFSRRTGSLSISKLGRYKG